MLLKQARNWVNSPEEMTRGGKQSRELLSALFLIGQEYKNNTKDEGWTVRSSAVHCAFCSMESNLISYLYIFLMAESDFPFLSLSNVIEIK